MPGFSGYLARLPPVQNFLRYKPTNRQVERSSTRQDDREDDG
jgi:hypothetical protein